MRDGWLNAAKVFIRLLMKEGCFDGKRSKTTIC